MSPRGRAVFALFAFLPTLGVIALAAYLATSMPDGLPDPETLLRSRHVPLPLVVLGVGATAIAMVQIGVGVFTFAHCMTRRDLSAGERVLWPLLCLFVGSIALPIFFFTKTKISGSRSPAG